MTQTRNQTRIFLLSGILFTALAGSALHFLFDWSGRFLPVALISPSQRIRLGTSEASVFSLPSFLSAGSPDPASRPCLLYGKNLRPPCRPCGHSGPFLHLDGHHGDPCSLDRYSSSFCPAVVLAFSRRAILLENKAILRKPAAMAPPFCPAGRGDLSHPGLLPALKTVFPVCFLFS